MAGDSVEVRIGGSSADLLREIDKLIQAQDKAERGFGQMGRAAQKAGADTSAVGHAAQSMGQSAAAGMKSFLTGTLASIASIGTLIGLMEKRVQMEKEAGDKLAQAEGSMASLAQLAETPQQMKRLASAAKLTRQEGGADSLDAAAKMVFELESAGVMKDRALYSSLGSSKLVDDPAKMAQAVAALTTAMGEKETGSGLELISKMFAASKIAPGSAQDIAIAAAKSGGLASELGISDEQVLAATSVIAKPAGSAEEGGTRFTAFLKSLADKGGFKGLNVEQAVQKIDAMGMNEQAMVEWFGRMEGFQGYSALKKNMGLYQQGLKDIEEGGKNNLVLSQIRLAESVPEIQAVKQSRIMQGRQEVMTYEEGMADQRARALTSAVDMGMKQDGWSYLQRLGMGGKMWAERLINGSEEFTSERGYGIPGLSTPDRDGTGSSRMDGAAGKLEAAAMRFAVKTTAEQIMGHPDVDPKGY